MLLRGVAAAARTTRYVASARDSCRLYRPVIQVSKSATAPGPYRQFHSSSKNGEGEMQAPSKSVCKPKGENGTGSVENRSTFQRQTVRSTPSSFPRSQPRTRRRLPPLDDNVGGTSVPSLREFVHRARVLRLYRDFLRAAKTVVPDDSFDADGPSRSTSRAGLVEEVRASFRSRIGEADPVSMRMAVKEGEMRLKQVRSMVGHHHASDDPDSWLNIKDEDDTRGRVGVEWPWDKEK